MRRVHVSHGRSRSRSRSPLLRGPKPVVSKTQPINMLDQAALLALRSKKESKTTTPRERITCTIDGPRRSGPIPSRMSGGFRNYPERRRSDGEKPYAAGLNRQSMRDRLSFGDSRGRDRFDSLRDHEVESSRFNGTFRHEDEGKPVQRLIDPTTVPKGKSYFGHDDRGEEKQWRGRNAYDPRIDLGPRRDRLSGFRGYGGRDRYDRRDRDGVSNRQYGSRSAADGVWTHDKYIELEGEEGSDNEHKSGVEVVVDQSSKSKSRRRIHEDDDDVPERH
ncbi:hypothetical protein V3C99_013771 [Haemonchus contortus]|uniref:Btz domain-containing protein n=1 Tax=Haemonchus contortus TaxID=6289 RepID=A0A7I5EBT1_HAECO|nr:unnamed protein product [Haemonchus contortus]